MTANRPPTTKNLIVGLSGPSSSGKTTLARLLRSIFNIPASPETNYNAITLFILHEDDFYKTDAEIPLINTPTHPHPIQDWDSAASLNLPLLEEALHYIHSHGHLPASLRSKEDHNEAGDSSGLPPPADIQTHRAEVIAALLPPAPTTTSSPARTELRICLLEGFLLYPNPNPHPAGGSGTPAIPKSITSLLDLKLFLRAPSGVVKARRRARAGYVTLEGCFWADPAGYVDEVVWPNYVREHGWMFEGGDVDEGAVVRGQVLDGDGEGEGEGGGGIRMGPGMGEVGVQGILSWAVGLLRGRVVEEMKGGLEKEGGRGR